MTTVSVRLHLADKDAETLNALQALKGDPDFLSEAVMKVVRLAQTTYTVKMDVEQMRALRKQAQPYREASGFDSEEAFLNRDR